MKLTESGIFDSPRFYGMNFKIDRVKFYSRPGYEEELTPFGLDLVVLPFAFLVCGLCLAALVFFVEKGKRTIQN